MNSPINNVPPSSDRRPLGTDLRPPSSDIRPPISGLRPPSSVLRRLIATPRLFLLAAIGARLFFLTGPIDNPAWRQAETAYMTLRMSEESPPEFFHSKVPYRGPKDVHLAELPIQPLITAYIYKALGRESMLAARMVTLLFFLGALTCLGLIVWKWFGAENAWITMAVYALMPLGFFFSRAVHVDFCIIFFSHLFLLAGMKFYDTGKWWYYGLSIAAATAAFAMKAPYCFYFGLPLAVWALRSRTLWNLRNVLTLGFVFVIPLTAAWAYNEHRIAVESGEEESLLYCMKWTHEFSRKWFFGTPAMRFDTVRWGVVVRRVFYLVCTPAGALLAMAGLIMPWFRRDKRGAFGLYALLTGVVLFMLVVFPHFSSFHDYYTLPLMAPAAILAALPLVQAKRAMAGKIKGWGGRFVLGLLLLFITAGSIYGMHRKSYFNRDWQRLACGRVIRRHTPEDALILSITKGRSTGWSDPRILYYADRRGWAIALERLTPEALALYQSGGAEVAALLMTPVYPPAKEEFGVLAEHPHVIHPISDPDGNPIGHVVLFDLRTGDFIH